MFAFGEKCWREADSFFVLLRDGPEKCRSYVLSGGRKLYFGSGDPFELIEKFVCSEEGEKVGYISYNLCEFVEKIKVGEDDLDLPYSIIAKVGNPMPPDKGIYHHTEKSQNLGWRDSSPIGEKLAIKQNQFEEREKFISNVLEIKRRIYRGDVYQVNISRRIDIQHRVTPEFACNFFARYAGKQKVKFPAFFDFSEFGFYLVSGSMELFLSKKGNVIREAPIKGTRKAERLSEEEIQKASDELRKDEKERAENLMIVDMVRNDIGKFCVPGSVKVKRLFDVERYSTVLHLVSEVEGVIKEGTRLSEILRSTFPPASVTGAPKKSAMQIIEQLERKRRGPYCGAICYFDGNGDFTMSVAIRISVFTHNMVYYWTGCGIVWDSDPEKEWEESITKTIAFMKSFC